MDDTDTNEYSQTCEYDSENQKTGFWIESSQYQEVGYYDKGRRTGNWVILQEGQQIGEGQYDEDNLQTGQWVEFLNNQIESGFYQRGKRFGVWLIYKQGEMIGSGRFDENKEKTGKWIEFEENNKNALNILQGQYSNGKRIGKWQILCDGEIIGVGQFDENFKKTGIWDEYSSKQEISLVDSSIGLCFGQKVQYYHQVGSYDQGFRTGTWKIFRDELLIGEGEYDSQDQKTGKWIEYNEDTEVGEYYQGKRKGIWKVLRNEQIIAEGEFNEENKRIGQWKVLEVIDIKEQTLLFLKKSISLNVSFKGEYRNGQKHGAWQAFDDQGMRITNADRNYFN